MIISILARVIHTTIADILPSPEYTGVSGQTRHMCPSPSAMYRHFESIVHVLLPAKIGWHGEPRVFSCKERAYTFDMRSFQ